MFTRFPTPLYLFFFLLLGAATSLRAQDCYEPFFPGTGLPTTVDDSLTAAACRLRANLPPAEQAAFRVLSVSEYQIGRYYQATDQAGVRERIRTDVAAENPFYVLFYWRSEPERLFASLELELRLPKTGFLSCMSELQRQALYAEYRQFADQFAAEHVENWGPEPVEKTVLDSLTARMGRIAECCYADAKSICDNCIDSQDTEYLLTARRGDFAHARTYGIDGSPGLPDEEPVERNGANYRIQEAAPVFVDWYGQSLRLADLLTTYFNTIGKQVEWEVLISGRTICSDAGQQTVTEFVNGDTGVAKSRAGQEKTTGTAPHYLYAFLDENNRLSTRSWTAGELYHPMDLETGIVVPCLLSRYPTISVATLRERFPGIIPDLGTSFAAYTPAGSLITLPIASETAFFPRVDAASDWPTGSVGAFRYNGQVYYGAWDTDRQVFLGYVCGESFDGDFCQPTAERTFYLPNTAAQPSHVIAATAEDGCVVKLRHRPYTSVDDARIHRNYQYDRAAEAPAIVASLDLPPFVGNVGLIFDEECLGRDGVCAALYADHPYLDPGAMDPISRYVKGNPCVMRTLEHYNFTVYPANTEWMEGFKNISAGLLGVGFSAAIAGPFLEAYVADFGRDKIKDGAVGFTVDILLQATLNYYFPAGEDITVEQAFSAANLDFAQASASAIEQMLAREGWSELLVAMSASCLTDGFTENGTLRDSFELKACLAGAASALVADLALEAVPWVRTRLQNLPRAKLARGFARIVGTQPALQRGFWSFYRTLHPGSLTAVDIESLFDVSTDKAADIAARLQADAALEQSFRDWWVELRTLATTTQLRGELLNDLTQNPNFVAALEGSADRVGLVRAWEVIKSVLPNSSTDVSILARLRDDLSYAPDIKVFLLDNPQYGQAWEKWGISFYSKADPVVEVFGPGRISHSDEWNMILSVSVRATTGPTCDFPPTAPAAALRGG